jgi:hypothetical protein
MQWTPVQFVSIEGSLHPPPHVCNAREISKPSPSCVAPVDSNHLISLSKAATTRYFSKISQECLEGPPSHAALQTSNSGVSANATGPDKNRPIATELHQSEGYLIESLHGASTENEREDQVPYMHIRMEHENSEFQAARQTAKNDEFPRACDNTTPPNSTSPAK